MTDEVRLGCNAGLGCGYRLRWTEWWNDAAPDQINHNEQYRKEKDDEVHGL